jgi:DNA polymerase IV
MSLQFPPIYLLNFRIPTYELLKLERQIGEPLVTNITEAKVVIGKVTKKARAKIEFQTRGVCTEEVVHTKDEDVVTQDGRHSPPPKKRRRIDKSEGKEVISIDSSTESEPELELRPKKKPVESSSSPVQPISSPILPEPFSPATSVASQEDIFGGNTIKVLTLEWYFGSLKAQALLPVEEYLVYEARIIPKPKAPPRERTKLPRPENIISRARADTPPRNQPFSHKYTSHKSTSPKSQPHSQRPSLIHQTTSEHDMKLPPMPAYMDSPYSCQRPTPLHCPNDDFIAQLKKIEMQRRLDRDDEKHISSLSYSKAIASIQAYPYTITSIDEIRRFKNCGDSVISYFDEWKRTGRIAEVDEIDADERIKTLKLFYGIHDVGEKTARSFYAKGWRDLDDVIRGWNELSRGQQVGVKYYDEFQEKIPRAEVEKIAAVVLEYANKIHPGFEMVICGGYRRGKSLCGDVDVILSHPDEDATENFIKDIVLDLGTDGWITHQLTLSTRNSNRGQETLAWKGNHPKSGSGFDTLDKAFVVWQDADLAKDPNSTKPNPHRRLDIIISPWKTAGCAVIGWSGGTQFERDLRKYCRREKGYKFDSTGVRRLSDGVWVDLEDGEGDLLEKEKRVFAGLGLDWREPTERCTG